MAKRITHTKFCVFISTFHQRLPISNILAKDNIRIFRGRILGIRFTVQLSFRALRVMICKLPDVIAFCLQKSGSNRIRLCGIRYVVMRGNVACLVEVIIWLRWLKMR